MEIKEPNINDLNPNVIGNGDPKAINLPYGIFGNKDFSPRNDLYLQKIFEIGEVRLTAPDIHIDGKTNITEGVHVSICKHPMFVKCQHIIIHNPSILTLEFAQKSWIESVANENKGNLFVKRSPIKIGNTSRTAVKELLYYFDPNQHRVATLASVVRIMCRIDLKTKKPLTICDTRRKFENIQISKNNEIEMIRMNKLNHKMRMNLNEMINILNNNDDVLFESKLQIQYTDLDRNHHVNQSVYGKYIENVLYQYCQDYFDGKYHIAAVTVHYIDEIRIFCKHQSDERLNEFPLCSVRIFYDNTYRKRARVICGDITYYSNLCLQFKVILVPYRHKRLFKIKTRL